MASDREMALEALRAVQANTGAPEAARVQAAKTLLQATGELDDGERPTLEQLRERLVALKAMAKEAKAISKG